MVYAHTPSDIEFSRDGSLVLTGGDDNVARIWDATTLSEVQGLAGHTEPITTVAWSVDGRLALTGSSDGTVRVWNARNGKQIALLSGHRGPVTDVEITADGKRVYSASEDGTVRVWEAPIRTVLLASDEDVMEVSSASFSDDGSRVAALRRDGEIRVTDLADGNQRSLEPLATSSSWVALSGDGERMLTGLSVGSLDESFHLWNASTGEHLHEFEVDDVYGRSALSANGRRALIAAWDNTALLLDTATGEVIQRLEGHQQRIFELALNADGTLVATGSEDNTIRLWDADTGTELTRIIHQGSGTHGVAPMPAAAGDPCPAPTRALSRII